MRSIRIGRQCIGSGQCELLVPEVFEVGEDNRSHTRDDIEWTPALDKDIDEAALSCPTNAIEVEP